MIRTFQVRMRVPDGADAQDCASYIHDAVSSMGGALQPPGYMIDDPSYSEQQGDPMFGHHKAQVLFKFHGQDVWLGDEEL